MKMCARLGALPWLLVLNGARIRRAARDLEPVHSRTIDIQIDRWPGLAGSAARRAPTKRAAPSGRLSLSLQVLSPRRGSDDVQASRDEPLDRVGVGAGVRLG